MDMDLSVLPPIADIGSSQTKVPNADKSSSKFNHAGTNTNSTTPPTKNFDNSTTLSKQKLSSSKSQSSSTVAVTPQRKQELLLEARRARVEWVDSSSLPFRSFGFQTLHEESSSNETGESNANGEFHPQNMNLIQGSHAGQSMPSAMDVINMLYGVGEEEGGGLSYEHAHNRIAKQLSSQISSEDAKKAMIESSSETSTSTLLPITTSKSESFQKKYVFSKNKKLKESIESYDNFIQKLQSPESADIVQSTKHFIHSIPDIIADHSSKSSNGKKDDSKEQDHKNDDNDVVAAAKHVAQSIQSYIDTRIESIQKGNPQNKNSSNKSDDVHPDTSKNKTPESISPQRNIQSALQRLKESIQTYVDSTCESIKKSHAESPSSSIWLSKNGETSDEEEKTITEQWQSIQMALETFIFSKCHEAIWSILGLNPMEITGTKSSGKEMEPNRRIKETMKQLQFVNAQHLEIQCVLKCDAYLKYNNVKETEKSEEIHGNLNKNDFNLREIFMTPIQILQSLSGWYSPSDKLLCIHEAYKEIVLILSNLSNSTDNTLDSTDSNISKLKSQPSADDILPAFIYVLIQAQPYPIVSNLMFVECLAKEQQLRGEAGYAFTNLYGAVQFLMDLNMNVDDDTEVDEESKDNKAKLPFAIEAEEWKTHLRAYQEKKMSDISKHSNLQEGERYSEKNDEKDDHSDSFEFPSASEIRAARLRRENVDMTWIQNWQMNNSKIEVSSSVQMEEGKITTQKNGTKGLDSKGTNLNTRPTFPVGFTRSYNFLGKKPQDIRVGDIPNLLAEYHQLVNVCETMVSERNAIQKESLKLKIQRERSQLQKNAVAVDVSTLSSSA